MAAVAVDQVKRLFQSAAGGYGCVLYEVKRINSNDSWDGANEWSVITHTFLSPTTRGIPASLPTVNGTVVTFAQAGMVNDSGYFYVSGTPK